MLRYLSTDLFYLYWKYRFYDSQILAIASNYGKATECEVVRQSYSMESGSACYAATRSQSTQLSGRYDWSLLLRE